MDQFFDSWLKSIGRSRVTGWRWEREGRIKTRIHYGRKFVSAEEIARFNREGDGVQPATNFARK